MNNIKSLIHKYFASFFAFLVIKTYFRKISIYGEVKNTENQAEIYLLSHRNGAVDGWVYGYALPNAIFTLAKQLQKNVFIKAVFPGIAIFRKKDSENYKTENIAAFKLMLRVLKNKQNSLAIFPEGTSSLGIKHLAFEDGAAQICRSFIRQNKENIAITPVAIFYDAPTELGGKVYIAMGKKNIIEIEENIAEIHKIISTKMEKILVEYDTEQAQKTAHQAALILSLYGKKYDYLEVIYKLRKQAEKLAIIAEKIAEYENKLPIKLLFYKQVEIFPDNLYISLWTSLITTPLVFFAFICNLLPVILGFFAGKKADEKHTISLFRILTGYPLAILQYVILFLILACFYGVLYSLLFIFIALFFSIWGFNLYGAWKKNLFSVINYLKYRKGQKEFQGLKNELEKELNN
ncbi:MAG: 1-acyl-sn-glycerol-3-phosphate acyltransferase [Cardiobacteriaceae bacterium]|nr:1-acyl-sn-glycerol-3-phosphate acyltransferase [Cardiobacteriaceae bacterium]